jgi:hypothetical protein
MLEKESLFPNLFLLHTPFQFPVIQTHGRTRLRAQSLSRFQGSLRVRAWSFFCGGNHLDLGILNGHLPTLWIR